MKINRKKLIWFLLVIAIAAAGAVFFALRKPKDTAANDGSKKEAAQQDVDRTFTLKKGELVLGINQPGTVSAKKKHRVVPQANVRTTIVWIIEENAKVKKGDIVAKLDATDLENRILDEKIELENLEKEEELAKETQKLEDSTQAANMKAAEDRVAKADDALRKYLRFERRQKRDSLDLDISNAETKLDDAEETYRNYKANPETDTDEDKQKEYKKKCVAPLSQSLGRDIIIWCWQKCMEAIRYANWLRSQ